MKILVTGGCGFIGSHLCLHLLAERHNVICLDRCINRMMPQAQAILNHPQCKVIQHDVKDPIDIDADLIYHLACPASPSDYQRDPVDTFETVVLGTLNMLKLARKRKIALLQASTSEIYGTPEEHPQTEAYWGNVNPIGVRSCYNESKRAAESLCMDFHRKYQVDARIIRIFNTYGPYMRHDDGRVVTNFIRSTLLNEELVIYGEGSQTRSFQYIDDLIRGMTSLMALKDPYPFPVNLGNPAETTILNLAKIIIALTQSKSQLKFTAPSEDDPNRRKPDISRAKKLLGWEPQVQLEEGLKKTIFYYHCLLNGEDSHASILSHHSHS